ncbi:MAG: hypothetical protein HW421_1571 [Ignavibacteria bacterium]|nr:hypothetical protein [Ignavibacteria bacterium]
MRLKFIFCMFLFFCFSSELNSNSNEWQEFKYNDIFKKTNGSNEFVEIKCCDSLNCMVFIQYNGTCGNRIMSTTDGGLNWKDVYFDTCKPTGNQNDYFPFPILSISYPSKDLFIATGDSGFVLRTTDMGKTWSHYNFDKYRGIYYLRMINENYGFGWGGVYQLKNEYYKTTDGGKKWTIMNSNEHFNGKYVDELQAINDSLFYALYWETEDKSMRLLRVHGNWETWDTTYLYNAYRIHYMSFINEKVGWIGGELPIGASTYKKWVKKTTDGGYTWTTQLDSNMYAGPLFDLKFFDENYGFAASGWWTMVRTVNGGKTWEAERLTTDTNELHNFYIFTSLQVPSATNAYCIGDGISIWKFTRDWSKVSVLEPPEQGTPIGSYPNPANNIIFLHNLEGTQALLYSVTGDKVMEIQLNGANAATLDVSGLSAGVYFVRCGSRTEKFVKY